MKYLVLGNGILGNYLSTKNRWDNINRGDHEIDLTNPDSYSKYLDNYDVIINCIANTDTYSNDRDSHWDVNYKGVADLVDLCNLKNKKLVHISTDHVYSNSNEEASEDDVPVHCKNWYGYTKLLGEGYVILKCKSHLTIRCTHKKYPFTYEKAYINQIGNFDYVDKIGDIIADLIIKNAEGIFNVGTEEKTMYELAIKSKPDVIGTEYFHHETTPKNVTMKLEKIKKFFKNGNI